jgi:hypothetical protein
VTEEHEHEHEPVTEDALLGRRIVAVDLESVPDGYATLSFDDGTALEIRTSRIGHLLLSSGDTTQ